MNMIRAVLVALVGFAIGIGGRPLIGVAETKPSRKAPRASAGQPKNAAGGESHNARPAATAEKKIEAAQKFETAIFAGGCFWCTEFAFEQLAGVVDVESGYCGGTEETANYDEVHLGITGHAEAIRVTYDPNQITYDDLLVAFFDAHDPTQLNQQGEEDVGRQYRSAIFFANDEQQQQAKAKIADLEKKRVYKRRIVTKLEPLKRFYPAEDYHQDFARRNPWLPYIQSHAVPKAVHLRTRHPDLIRKEN